MKDINLLNMEIDRKTLLLSYVLLFFLIVLSRRHFGF